MPLALTAGLLEPMRLFLGSGRSSVGGHGSALVKSVSVHFSANRSATKIELTPIFLQWRVIMGSVEPRYSKEEFARRGDAIYEKDILPNLAAKDLGKFLAIDIDTGEYEIAANE